jgi:hypothetical protein
MSMLQDIRAVRILSARISQDNDTVMEYGDDPAKTQESQSPLPDNASLYILEKQGFDTEYLQFLKSYYNESLLRKPEEYMQSKPRCVFDKKKVLSDSALEDKLRNAIEVMLKQVDYDLKALPKNTILWQLQSRFHSADLTDCDHLNFISQTIYNTIKMHEESQRPN